MLERDAAVPVGEQLFLPKLSQAKLPGFTRIPGKPCGNQMSRVSGEHWEQLERGILMLRFAASAGDGVWVVSF